MLDILKKLRQKNTPQIGDNAETVAKHLRGERSDEEWRVYLEQIAERQVEILNKMVEFQGPEGVVFHVTVEDTNVNSIV